jgi:hypothetical protein
MVERYIYGRGVALAERASVNLAELLCRLKISLAIVGVSVGEGGVDSGSMEAVEKECQRSRKTQYVAEGHREHILVIMIRPRCPRQCRNAILYHTGYLHSLWRYCTGMKEWDMRVVASDARGDKNETSTNIGCKGRA